mmetsp:Transcript_14262/g.49146  ORF Transcript_14262/g.49146 Transcript_14262/m.49146 type:complete len:240 (+) Transcript_14262:85-804(+)
MPCCAPWRSRGSTMRRSATRRSCQQRASSRLTASSCSWRTTTSSWGCRGAPHRGTASSCSPRQTCSRNSSHASWRCRTPEGAAASAGYPRDVTLPGTDTLGPRGGCGSRGGYAAANLPSLPALTDTLLSAMTDLLRIASGRSVVAPDEGRRGSPAPFSPSGLGVLAVLLGLAPAARSLIALSCRIFDSCTPHSVLRTADMSSGFALHVMSFCISLRYLLSFSSAWRSSHASWVLPTCSL